MSPNPSSKQPRREPPKPTPPVAAPVSAEKPAKARHRPRPPFPWMAVQIPEGVRVTFENKFLAMHRRELAERAALLRRLGFGKEEVRRRLEDYEIWEYEPFHSSRLHQEVAAIVEEVFTTASPRSATLAPGR